ncbi:Sec-independent protein translocase protein TatB [Sulfurovum sp.]|uniref:Sec-independent protein translocase protein TatB n=1 Tax=Sulfurovum sp. TaxID=1969726 RepID=UPI0025E3D814|nr:Sec-independent protein translocase protein TatB [Sulfurovum sp.]
MFGIGFTEILLIAIIAILFLGPDKLPEAMVQIAKFIKSVKKTIGDAKSSLDEELRIADLKEEALNYKQQLDSATDELRSFKNIGLDDMQDIIYDTDTHEIQQPEKASPYADERPAPQVEEKSDTVTFKKKSKKKKKTSGENDQKPEKPATNKDKIQKNEDKA